MRQRRSDPGVLAFSLLLTLAVPAWSQGNATGEGALFLLLPVGARAVGMGQAVTATASGGDAIWWNPAGQTDATRVEIHLHHSQSLAGTADAVSVLLPHPLLGSLSISVSTVDFGEQELAGPGGGTGLLVPRSFVFGASYAAALAPWLSAGLTYKIVQLRVDCSGACQDVQVFTSTTSAVDFGLRLPVTPSRRFTLGVAVRNVGPRLQVVDSEQADALPARLHLGVDYRVWSRQSAAGETQLRLAAELVDRLKIGGPSVRIGGEIAHDGRFFLRGGYDSDEGGGPSVGGGIVAGSFAIDIGRVLAGLSADLGQPPTHISLRYRF
jgi:hypothetical protein